MSELREDLLLQSIAGCLLAFAGLVLLDNSLSAFSTGNTPLGIEYLGVTVMLFGSCLDPLNAVWRILPFTSRDIVKPLRFSRAGGIVMGFGFTLFAIGWLGKHWT